ncbi:MAG: hypothetical protein IPM48_07005 [Saprospiraceae bacterium]|nr:hypothetical protein [Saprospiraceae bacterium]
MKTICQLNLIVLFILLTFNLVCQTDDKQWLIKNGKFKNQYSIYSDPTFTSGDNSINFTGITTPVNPPGRVARNDFFIIYNNGNYYNSRTYPNPLLFGGNGISAMQINPIPFQDITFIKYLYLTNIYEDDDNPNYVSLSPNTLTGSFTPISPFPPASNQVTTNHSLVRGKDYTIIIPKEIKEKCDDELKLKVNDDIFTGSPVFQNGSSYSISFNSPSVIYTPVIGIPNITFENEFINLRVKYDYPNDYNGSTIKSELFCGDRIVQEFEDLLLPYHDPNFIEIRCISNRDGKYVIQYYVQVQNDGASSVGNISLKMKLPYCVDPSTLTVGAWRYGTCGGCGLDIAVAPTSYSYLKLSKVIDNIKFSFIGVGKKCKKGLNPLSKEGSIASVSFCVAVKPETNLSLLSDTDLLPQLPTSSFNGQVYNISKFNPQRARDGSLIMGNCKCGCYNDY